MNRTLISGLLITLGFLMVAPEAKAHHNYPDSDGRVLSYWVCDPDTDWGGWTSSVRTEEKVENTVYVNWCLIYKMGGGPWDLYRTWLHERYHAAGFDHYEGHPFYNKAYYPREHLCGC